MTRRLQLDEWKGWLLDVFAELQSRDISHEDRTALVEFLKAESERIMLPKTPEPDDADAWGEIGYRR